MNLNRSHSQFGRQVSVRAADVVVAAGALALFAGRDGYCPAAMKAPGTEQRATHKFSMAGANEAVIEINGAICDDDDYWCWDQATPGTVAADIKAAGVIKLIRVRLNSGGGSALGGAQIYNVLRQAVTDGIEVVMEVGAACMSAATLVACAGTKVLTAPNSLWMLHNASAPLEGTANEHRAIADVLDKLKDSVMTIYQARNPGFDHAQLTDKPVYYTGQEAVDAGWADGLLDQSAPVDATMSFDPSKVDLSTVSDGVRKLLGDIRAAMDGNNPNPNSNPAPTPADPLASLRGEVSTLAATVAALAERIPVPADPANPTPTPTPVPAATLQVDPNSSTVKALASLAKLDGQTEAFDLAVQSGATLVQLQERFVSGAALRSPETRAPGQMREPTPPGKATTMKNPADYYAIRKSGGAKPAK